MQTSNPDLKREGPRLGLIKAAGRLKTVKRTGWLKRVGIAKDRESVADHTFRMIVIAAEIGLEQNLDCAKLMRMCMLHDLGEAVIGDKMPEEKKSHQAHRENENRVVKEILKNLPENSRTVLQREWAELLESKTKEAKLVWQIDKLEMALQARDYILMGYDQKRLSVFQKDANSLDGALLEFLRAY